VEGWDPSAEDEGAAYFAAKVHPKLHFLCPLVLTFVFPQPKSAPKARTEKKEKVFIESMARFDRPDRGGRGGGGGRAAQATEATGSSTPRGRGGGWARPRHVRRGKKTQRKQRS